MLTALLLVNFSSVRAAGIEDSQTIGLFSDEEPVVATSPIPRPTSKIAENVTVITAEEMQRLNAHTLAEVLQTVPGIQLDVNQRSPGSFNFFNIQGALNTTVLVLIDGIRLNDYDQDLISPSRIPVQQIERIEIIKGAASGSWGSALGGVINIVTKPPNPERGLSGLLSQSAGSGFTMETRAEVSGTKDRVGYYLTAGDLRSDGLSPNTSTSLENLYGKVSYALPTEGTATVGVSHVAAWPGEGEGAVPRRGFIHQNSETLHTYGFMSLQQPLGNKLALNLLGYGTGFFDGLKNGGHDSRGDLVNVNRLYVRSATRGVDASVSWGDSRDNVVTGVDYAHVKASAGDQTSSLPPIYDRTWNSFAWYCNGSYSIGNLAVLPGVRFDSTGFSGDHMSYMLGLTYQISDRTTLRAYAAQGFSLPLLVNDTGTQKVRTAQGGIETGAIPFLWLKGTYFFNALRNSESVGPIGEATSTDQDRQGFELEARTTPLFGVSLRGGYTYLYANNEKSGQRLQTNSQQTVPPQVYKLGVDYDHPGLGLRGSLTGSGVVWHASPGYPARANGMVWDLSLNWKPKPGNARAPELFFSAHNLFDAVQTTNTILYTNESRWYEGGVRFPF